MRRRLAWAALLLVGGLLLVAARLDAVAAAKAEVLATATAAPAESAPHSPAPPGAVQQAAFVPEASASGPPSSVPPPGPPAAVPMPFSVGPMMPSTPAPAPPAPKPPAAAPKPPAAAPVPLTPLTPGAALSDKPARVPSAPPPSAPPAAPARAAAMVSVEVMGPPRLALGQPLAHEIIVRNRSSQAVAEVHVEEPLPAGARVLRSEPTAETRGHHLSWDIGTLEAGAEKRLKVELQPGDTGELHLQPYVAFRGEGLSTQVARPPFAVEVTADRDKVVCGDRVTFRIRVSNHGDALIRNIKLYDTLPPGLQHPAGKIIGMTNFGDLQPGESRPLTLETTAIQAGQFRNEIIAQADGGIEARTGVDVVVTEPSLSLHVDGPKQGVTRQDIDFHLELTNPGPATAKGLRLVQTLPPSFEAVAASTGAAFDPKQHALVWSLPDLAPQQRQMLTFRVKATAAGDWPLYTAVGSDNISETRVAHVLRVEGAPMLRLEVRAREQRLDVGAETVYEMHVFNQGDAPCPGVRLTAVLPDEVTPLDAQGPAAGQIERQQVRFASLDKLPSRGEAVYRVHVRGRQAGTGHVRVELTADKQSSVRKEVSVQVNAGSISSSGTQPVGHTNSAMGENLR